MGIKPVTVSQPKVMEAPVSLSLDEADGFEMVDTTVAPDNSIVKQSDKESILAVMNIGSTLKADKHEKPAVLKLHTDSLPRAGWPQRVGQKISGSWHYMKDLVSSFFGKRNALGRNIQGITPDMLSRLTHNAHHLLQDGDVSAVLNVFQQAAPQSDEIFIVQDALVRADRSNVNHRKPSDIIESAFKSQAKASMILAPFVYPGSVDHIVYIAVDKTKKEIQYFDPKGSLNASLFEDKGHFEDDKIFTMKEDLQVLQEKMGDGYTLKYGSGMVHQADFTSCGRFVLDTARRILLEGESFDSVVSTKRSRADLLKRTAQIGRSLMVPEKQEK